VQVNKGMTLVTADWRFIVASTVVSSALEPLGVAAAAAMASVASGSGSDVAQSEAGTGRRLHDTATQLLEPLCSTRAGIQQLLAAWVASPSLEAGGSGAPFFSAGNRTTVERAVLSFAGAPCRFSTDTVTALARRAADVVATIAAAPVRLAAGMIASHSLFTIAHMAHWVSYLSAATEVGSGNGFEALASLNLTSVGVLQDVDAAVIDPDAILAAVGISTTPVSGSVTATIHSLGPLSRPQLALQPFYSATTATRGAGEDGTIELPAAARWGLYTVEAGAVDLWLSPNLSSPVRTPAPQVRTCARRAHLHVQGAAASCRLHAQLVFGQEL
jgi:hypothetical protein